MGVPLCGQGLRCVKKWSAPAAEMGVSLLDAVCVCCTEERCFVRKEPAIATARTWRKCGNKPSAEQGGSVESGKGCDWISLCVRCGGSGECVYCVSVAAATEQEACAKAGNEKVTENGEKRERKKDCGAERKGAEECAKAESRARGSVEKWSASEERESGSGENGMCIGSVKRPTHFIYIRDSSGSAAERSGNLRYLRRRMRREVRCWT